MDIGERISNQVAITSSFKRADFILKTSRIRYFVTVFFFFVIVGFHSWDVTLFSRESPKQKAFPLTNESRGSLRGVGGGGGDRRSGPLFPLSYTTWDSTHCLVGGQTWGWTTCVPLKCSALLDFFFFFFFKQFLENSAPRYNLTAQIMKCYEDLRAQDLQEPSKCLLIKHLTVPTLQHP